MADAITVGTILNTAAFELLDCLCNIGRDRAELGVRHKAARTEDTTETTNFSHHLRRSNRCVEIDLAALDVSDQVIGADDICASFFCCTSSVALSEDRNANGLTRAVRKAHRTAKLLICLARIKVQTNVHIDRLVEVRERDILHERHSLKRSIELFGHLSFSCSIFLTHISFLSWS